MAVRELNRRSSDGIDVRLTWDDQSSECRIHATDRDQSWNNLDFAVPGREAALAFRHPWGYRGMQKAVEDRAANAAIS